MTCGVEIPLQSLKKKYQQQEYAKSLKIIYVLQYASIIAGNNFTFVTLKQCSLKFTC